MSDNELELDVNRYDIGELYSILRLREGAPQEEVRAAASRMISKMQSRGNTTMAQFFRDIQSRLVAYSREEHGGFRHSYQPIGTDPIQKSDDEDEGDIERGGDAAVDEQTLAKWLGRQHLDRRDPAIDSHVPRRRRMTQTFGDNQVMKQEAIGVKQTFPVDVAQGENNPNLINTTKMSIVVDSKLRTTLFPYNAENPNAAASTTQFDVTLANPLKECISLELTSVCVPKSWYNVDEYLGTNVMWVNDYAYYIPSGFYDPYSLATALTDIAVPPLTDVSYNTTTGKFSLNFTNLDPTPLDISVVFWDQGGGTYTSSNARCTTQPVPNARVDFNLGYIMGFRESGPTSGTSFTVGVAPNNKYSLRGQAIADLEGTKNLYIMVEDHNQNRLNSQILPMAQTEKQIIRPNSYIPPDLSYSCLFGQQTPYYFANKPGLGVTQAQLYTINAIAANQSVSKERVIGPQQSNILGVIPVSGYDVPWGRNIVASSAQLQTNRRVYFGPVALNKLSIKLIDDVGNVVNLNGRDWSFTATAVSLYQY